MRRLLASLILLLPLVAAGQVLGGGAPDPAAAAARHVAAYRALEVPGAGGNASLVVPLWRDADGRMLALVSSSTSGNVDSSALVPDFRVVDVSQGYRTGLRYDIGPHVAAYAQLIQRNWPTLSSSPVCLPSDGVGCPDAGTLEAARTLSGEIGASYSGGRYRFDLMFDSTRPRLANTPLLPRVLPQYTASWVPLWSLDRSTNLSARGRMALGNQTGIDLGASVGRIRLLPGNLLGMDGMNQQSLSFGIDSGPLSGRITGRMMQPIPGSGRDSLLNPGQRWTSIDLGVTWRLPWQGELRFGARNLWSSGQAPVPVDGSGPTQSSIPYVQYHQDL